MSIFDDAPDGIQPAPAEPRLVAAGAQVRLREINLAHVRDKDDLMLAFTNDLPLTIGFGRNWDALYDVLSDPEIMPQRLALVLCDYPDFQRHHAKLAAELGRVLLDAQTALAGHGKALWLLWDLPESEG